MLERFRTVIKLKGRLSKLNSLVRSWTQGRGLRDVQGTKTLYPQISQT